MASFSNTECSICNNKYNNGLLKPFVITTCGHTYCKSCLEKIENDQNVCPECREPITSKIENRIVLDFVEDIEIKNKQLEAKDKFHEIQTLIATLEKVPPINSVAFVQQYYAKIKTKVTEHFDKTMQELRNKSKQMLETLENLKKQAINNIPSVQKAADFTELKLASIPKWDKELKKQNTGLKQIDDLIKELNENISNIENSQSNFEDNLLMKNKVKFEPAAIDSKLLGKLSIIKRLESENGFYIGEVVGGNMEGKGDFNWKTGDKYSGEWRNNLRSGKGTYSWADGDRYEGEWKNHMQEGRGLFYWSNGNRFEGLCLNGLRHGKGIFYSKNGKIERQEWKNGKLIKLSKNQ